MYCTIEACTPSHSLSLSLIDWVKSNLHKFHHIVEVRKRAKIRNRYNQVTHLAQNTNGKVTNSQLDTTNKSQEVSPFQVGDHKAQINRQTQRFNKHETWKNIKVSNGAKIRNRYNQVPHLTQDTNGKVTNSQKTPQTRAKRSALSQQVTTKHI